MKPNRFFSLISKICAETSVSIPQGVSPQDVMQKLSKRFKSEPAGYGVMTFRKKSLFFSGVHFLEMRVADSAIVCRLRVGKFDKAVVTFFLLLTNSFPILGVVMLAMVGTVDRNGILVTIAMFFMAVFLNLFIWWLYRFLRWISGMANPERMLEQCGIPYTPSDLNSTSQ